MPLRSSLRTVLRLLPSFFLALGAGLGLARVAIAAPEALDRIVVVVNDGVILESEIDRAMENARTQIAKRGIAAPPEEILRAQVLEQLILTRVQTQRAQQAGVRIDDRELNEVLGNIAKQNGMSLSAFADAVRSEGMDYLTLREQIRDEVTIQRLRNKEVDSRVQVTDQDVDAFLATEGAAADKEYRLSHILIAVPDGASQQVRDQARAKAADLLKRIRAGEDFAQLAIANSNGQQALQGGDLDWRKAGDLPGVFASIAGKLKKGETSDIFETGSGYHLIKLSDVRGADTERKTVTETHARHILIQTNAIRDDEQSRALAHDLYTRLKGGEDFAKLAKEFSDDPGSRNSGGDLGFQPPGVFVPEFQTRLDALQPKEISEPFRTQFGWHIAQLLERRERDVTEDQKRARARTTIGTRKAAEEYDVWLRRLRNEAYIEYRLPSDADAAKQLQ
ncbi:peptidylprolyl isomerase [Solimonas soli]|uniref:peptidylprolyl isomerase n=1 Tax=Solimonas soli TaxID=413479 RepID=UPI00047F3372|nr:peptidylprolyl isomerase [Solimonas soli]